MRENLLNRFACCLTPEGERRSNLLYYSTLYKLFITTLKLFYKKFYGCYDAELEQILAGGIPGEMHLRLGSSRKKFSVLLGIS